MVANKYESRRVKCKHRAKMVTGVACAKSTPMSTHLNRRPRFWMAGNYGCAVRAYEFPRFLNFGGQMLRISVMGWEQASWVLAQSKREQKERAVKTGVRDEEASFQKPINWTYETIKGHP